MEQTSMGWTLQTVEVTRCMHLLLAGLPVALCPKSLPRQWHWKWASFRMRLRRLIRTLLSHTRQLCPCFNFPGTARWAGVAS